jgi:membrane protein YdbS with pleckstrin-like domain
MLATPEERIRLDERRHAVVLAGPFARALALSGLGLVALWLGWPLSAAGAVLLALGALLAVRAVWRWERTHVVVTTEKLFVVHGTLRRRAAAVRLGRVGAVELEQTLLGRLLGYGTVTAGELEISYVARPRELTRLLDL